LPPIGPSGMVFWVDDRVLLYDTDTFAFIFCPYLERRKDNRRIKIHMSLCRQCRSIILTIYSCACTQNEKIQQY